MSKKYKDHYLPVEVIIAATQGEAAAIQTVLKLLPIKAIRTEKYGNKIVC